ncbi:metallophosphoesterase [Mesorhizobium sp. MSK_1335]|uniref:Metallophosphoesterase n=1 Tax=Mesorhizobium montanum TaxID=3072323 RepID=A0ABU4ZTU7_9HYPH|nr:metallophosphoesterase [Mesorhizobium sp. MSK_1335]MDX8527754.1 metallophosphoesterase [Mesorhizobium sp. MSK_1335]
MATTATFLHVTDTHLADGYSSNQADHKVRIDGIAVTTKIEALGVTAELLAERLKEEKRLLDGILFTGDAQDKAAPNGHAELRRVLAGTLSGVMQPHCRFVATPGNHDVPQGSDPSGELRYAEFKCAWRDTKPPAVTPWLDGIDASPIAREAYTDHSLLAPDGTWAVYPINSCNWSHTQVRLPEKVETAFAQLVSKLDNLDAASAPSLRELVTNDIRKPIEKQLLYDIARVSEDQLAALKPIIRAGSGTQRPPLRIVLLHHHLMAPTLREEIRPFADITNLSALRTYLRQSEIDIVIHGHKHVDAIAYDSVYDHGARQQTDPRRLLVLSGGTFDGAYDHSSMSLIGVAGLPGAPRVEVERIPLGRRGFDLAKSSLYTARLWRTNEQIPGGPVVIHGKDIDDVYARAVRAANEEAHMGMLIVHLDLPQPELDRDGKPKSLPFPTAYPNPDETPNDEKVQTTAAWVDDLASWWQLSRSTLESRIPYIHGTRLRRFAGRFDQIKRIVSLLKSYSGTSRAVAVLIDPLRDFGPTGEGEDFASFCLVQFRRRPGKQDGNYLDCTAYYRAQEFKHWWPINVAELRRLQVEVANQVSCHPGRITTIAADARAVAARSPGQVAVPVVDRWLDQAPEKLMVLACLLCGVSDTWGAGNVIEEWRDYLKSQRRSADPSAFNPDGCPVAVNALEVLASYIEAHSGAADDIRELADMLRRLARENRNYEVSSKDRSAFDNWSLGIRQLCEDLLTAIPVALADADQVGPANTGLVTNG